MQDTKKVLVAAMALVGAAQLDCGPGTMATDTGMQPDSGMMTDTGGMVGSVPPMGEAMIEPWLMTASNYTGAGWRCEAMSHGGRTPSPHGRNRICVNDALYNAMGTGEFPVGAAAVKEIFDDPDGGTPRIIGYAAMRRTAAGAGGANWYFYERLPPGTMLPMGLTISATGVVADGMGNAGQAMTVCVGCHNSATTGTGRDLVFTPRPM